VHAWPHEPQSFALFVVSTHVPEQSVGALGEHPVEHVNPDPALLHTGAVAGQPIPHPPQCSGWLTSVSQPLSGLPSQSAQPGAHEPPDSTHVPDVEQATVPLTCGNAVQS
jgi:hypothetical protein